MIDALNIWLGKYEPIWLFCVLTLETIGSFVSINMLAKRLAQRKYVKRKKDNDTSDWLQGEGR